MEERDPKHGVYVGAAAHAVFTLRRERLLLDEDVLAYILTAAENSIGKGSEEVNRKYQNGGCWQGFT